MPKYLLLSSLEFDHGDIYRDLNHVIDAFASLLATMTPEEVVVVNHEEANIKEALARSSCQARILSYGHGGDFQASDIALGPFGARFSVTLRGEKLGQITLPLYGEHNLKNGLGCYAMLYSYGLTHDQIDKGFTSFLGVKRRLEERFNNKKIIVIDDFAHHPTAVLETIKGARQKYPEAKICAIFEPRSATSCMKIFERRFFESLAVADQVMIAPAGRTITPETGIDTAWIAHSLNQQGVSCRAYENYDDIKADLRTIKDNTVLLCMSNGDFKGLLDEIPQIVG